jgi:oligopeptide transport system permease protein
MASYIIRRVLWLAPVLFFVSLITFVLMHSVEGGPWDDGAKRTEADRARLDERYGLDDPLWRQYATFVTNALRGDLGVSFSRTTQDVREIIWEGAKVSFVLGGLAVGLATLIGVPLGVLSAVKKNGAWDYVGVTVATAGAAVPSFVVGIFLILVFAVRLDWFPVNGWGSPREAVMPVVALSLLPMAYLARITRTAVLDVLHEDYVRTAQAKGLSRWTVLSRHVFRNALVPILTVLGPVAAATVTGSFIIETMFGIPGIGREFISSIGRRDYGVIMGTTLFYCVIVALANLIVDVAYAFVDPRIEQR